VLRNRCRPPYLDLISFKEKVMGSNPIRATRPVVVGSYATGRTARPLVRCGGRISDGRFSFTARRGAVNGDGARRRSSNGSSDRVDLLAGPSPRPELPLIFRPHRWPRKLLVPLIAVLLLGGWVQLSALENYVRERCTESWEGATRVDVSLRVLMPDEVGQVSPVRTVEIAGRPFEIQGRANTSTGASSAPGFFYQPRTGFTFTIATPEMATLESLTPLCIRASHRGETWERRAHSHSPSTRGDGSAYGGAGACCGPAWRYHERAHLMLLISLEGQRYVLDAGEVQIVLVV
jgi:hypothetical protein